MSVPQSAHEQRRTAYMDAIGPNAVALVRSPAELIRNGDNQFPFRQSSDLYYLTGFVEPGSALCLRPGAEKERVVLFVRPKDPERETWNGRRVGVEAAPERFGVDAAYSIDELAEKLPELIANTDDLYFSLGLDPEFDRDVIATLAALRGQERKGRRAPRRVIDPREVLHELRLRKTAEEVELLRKAADISAEAHIAAMKAAGDGVAEFELEAIVDYTFRKNGGSGPGYPTIVASADNATILHYVENNRTMRDSDLVLIDAGCEYEFYTADITRTFPASGRFTDVQKRCYELVLSAEKQAIEMTRPGVTVDEIHDRVVEILTAGMIELGLLEGPVEKRIEDEGYKRFYMHKTSHWLGMDVHDVGNYTRAGDARPLEPGMVLTIEPGLYIPIDADDVSEELRGIGIRIEDDVLVTENGYENLTAAAPKEVEEIERACGA